MDDPLGTFFGMIILLVLMAVGIWLYVVPGIVASNRKHPQASAIWVLTLFLGWTLVGWVAALVWANTTPQHVVLADPDQPTSPEASTKLSAADEIAQFAHLRDSGVITAEEFEAKKKQLLGLPEPVSGGGRDS
jgi:hypothetical protein